MRLRAGKSIPFKIRHVPVYYDSISAAALRGDKRRGSRRARAAKSARLLRDEINALRFASTKAIAFNWTNVRSDGRN